MIKLESLKDCCGCTACESICHQSAIIMKPDNEGFLYPYTNLQKCNNCGLCEKVCPVIKYRAVSKKASPEVYAAVVKDDRLYFESSSGGIFGTLCDYVIGNGGIVYGAIYAEDFSVIHSSAETIDGCKTFHGSKYTQSNICGIYKQVKKILTAGRLVLFSGTPCQIAGLNGYLRKQYQNLITCDIVCHGVPSPKIFVDYLNFVKGKQNIVSVNMKSKIEGEKKTAISIKLDNGKEFRHTLKTDLWSKFYFSHYGLRPSCHDCQFTHLNRSGDITIGDFWHYDKIAPGFHSEKCISLILINSGKGLGIFDAVKEKLYYRKSSLEDCKQPQLQYPVRASEKRELFWNDYNQKGFMFIAKKYLDYSIYNRSKAKIKRLFK